VNIAAGYRHAMAVTSDGTAWTWGKNTDGQLGNFTHTPSSVPVKVLGISDVRAIAGGSYHSLAVVGSASGTVVGWGYNAHGELGDGTDVSSSGPVLVSGLSSGGKMVAGGEFYGMALSATGQVAAWGFNFSGQIGNGTNTNAYVPVAVGSLPPIATIAAGGNTSLAVERTGTALPKLTVPNMTGQKGKTVTITATLKSGTQVLAGREVQFAFDGFVLYGSYFTDPTGRAKLVLYLDEGMAIGTHAITTFFAGDNSTFAPVTTNSTLTITRGDVKIKTASVSGHPGDTKTLTATLTNATSTPLPGQVMTFKLAGNAVGTATTDASGAASYAYHIPTNLPEGIYPTAVDFAGNADHLAGTTAGKLTVTKSTVKLTVTSVSGHPGASVVLTAKLLDYLSAPLSGATLTFSVNGVAAGSAVTDSAGVAHRSYAIPAATPLGTYLIGAAFAGDGGHLALSKTGNLTVK
jgi:hypothetical protein